jgi:hypothetical protein
MVPQFTYVADPRRETNLSHTLARNPGRTMSALFFSKGRPSRENRAGDCGDTNASQARANPRVRPYAFWSAVPFESRGFPPGRAADTDRAARRDPLPNPRVTQKSAAQPAGTRRRGELENLLLSHPGPRRAARCYSKPSKNVGKVPTSPSTMSPALISVIDRSGGFARRQRAVGAPAGGLFGAVRSWSEPHAISEHDVPGRRRAERPGER